MKPVEHYIVAAAELIRPIYVPDDKIPAGQQSWDSVYSEDLRQAVRPMLQGLSFVERARLAVALFMHSASDDISHQAAQAVRTELEQHVLRLHDPCAALTAEEIAAALDLAHYLTDNSGWPEASVPRGEFLARVRWAVLALPQPERRAAA